MTHPGCVRRYGLDGMFASLVYTRPVKKLIYEFKYKPYVSDLKNFLSQLFIEGIIQEEAFMKAISADSIFVPIPLHPSKKRQRGFNHAELLAKSLSGHFNIPLVDILIRQKHTVSQFGLTREKRKENLKDAFTLRNQPQTSTIILVDDIVTSGTTFSEAAKVLKRNGVKGVYGIALAHGR
jgi:competence protein ComFC